MFKIYSKQACTSCTQAKLLLDVKGVSYEYLSLGKDYNISEFTSYSKTHKTFPLIVKDGEYFGGLKELKEYFEQQNVA